MVSLENTLVLFIKNYILKELSVQEMEKWNTDSMAL
jgi:hypothetical protein